MPDDPALAKETDVLGHRGQKKAQRRQEILRCAEHLFAREGVEAATVSAIASMAGVTSPTVFNYFGSKENILKALIFEGAQQKRLSHQEQPRKTDCPFADVMHGFLCEVTENTLQIAGKRVWRYAEAANIRRPDSEFGQQFTESDNALVALFGSFMGDYELVLKSSSFVDHSLLSRLFFDRWTARFFEFIKDETMTMASHAQMLRDDVEAMVALMFHESFAAHSPLKQTEVA